MGHSVHWKVAGCFCTRLADPASWLLWFSGSASRNAMTLLGTADVDCLLLEAAERRSRGDRDREDDWLGDRLAPNCPGDVPWLTDRFIGILLLGWKGSVTERGRDLGRPRSIMLVTPGWSVKVVGTYLDQVVARTLGPVATWIRIRRAWRCLAQSQC